MRGRGLAGEFSRGVAAAAFAFGALMPAATWASFETDIVERWYLLLSKANAAGLEGLLAPKATVKLDDQGVTQTKKEFLGSMDEWAQAMDGGTIRYRIESAKAGSASALVCYHFKANDMLARESFKIANGLITRSEQAKVADDCAAF